MSLTKRVGLVAGAAALSLTGASYAGTGADNQDLQARVKQLEAKLAQLEGQQSGNWMNEQRAQEIRSLVNEVLADADTRSSLLAQDGGAGYNNGFFLASGDGNFRLNLSGQMQFRYVLNMQDDTAADSTRSGFENRRTKLSFSGHVFDPSWNYRITGAFTDEFGAFLLEDAYIKKTLDNGMALKMGQFKLPFLREELVSSANQLAVERSLLNETYNQDWSQGIQLSWSGEQFRWMAAFSDGFGARNTPAVGYDTEWAFTGRVEFLAAGGWDQFRDFTSWQGEDYGALIGGAVHYQNQEYGTAMTNELELLTYTIDLSLEFGGANLFAAFVGRSLDNDNGTDLDQYGFIIQGGVFLTEDFELFGRYEWSDFDIDGAEDLSVFTVGVNKYWNRHGLKWTTDVGFGFDEVSALVGTGGTGWRPDPTDEDGQIVIRSQLQLLF